MLAWTAKTPSGESAFRRMEALTERNEFLFNIGGIEQNRVLLLRTKVCFGLLLATRAHIAETDLLDLPYMSLPTILCFVVS